MRNKGASLGIAGPLVCVAWLVGLAPSAQAQSTAVAQPTSGDQVQQQDALSPPDPQAATTQDVVVTAQRRSERIQDVPITINAISGEGLRDAGVTRLEDIGRIAPGVQVSRTGVYTQPAIRGITTLQSATVENNVAVYIDGFYQVSPRSLNLDLMNVSSLEVLKGPQGTLFGRNATGGAILVNTLQPSFSQTDARISVGYGSFNDIRAQGYVSVPITDQIAFNVTGSYRSNNGYIHNVTGFDTAPLNLYTVDAKLRIQPTDSLTVTAGFRYNEVSDGRGLAITLEGHSLAALVAPTSTITKADNQTSINHEVINNARQYTGTLKGEYDAGPVTITSLTQVQRELNHSHFDIDGSLAKVYDQYYNENFTTITQEVNLRSNGHGRLQYVVGAYYFDSRNSLLDNFSVIFPATVYTKQPQPFNYVNAIAGYGDVTWQPVDRLFLTGGLRYSHEVRNLREFSGAGALLADIKTRFNSATPRAVVRYEITPATSVYASYSKGFKSGFINAASPFTTVRPEKINAYEIGFKHAAHGVSFNTAAFYYDYSNLQVSSIVLINGSQSTVTTNAASARIYGAEASASLPVTPNFVTTANVAYTHARYDSFPNAVVSLPNAVTGLNSSSCANPIPPPATTFCTQNWSGLQIARAPDWSGNAGGTYTVHAGRSRIGLTANVAFTSSYLPTKSDIGLNGTGYRYQQNGYALLQLAAAWTLPGDRITLTVFGNNVTNHNYYIVKTGSAFGDYHVYGEPASIGGRLDYRF